MRKCALLLVTAVIVAACGSDTVGMPSESTAAMPAPSKTPAPTAAAGISTRADVVEYCSIEDHSWDPRQSDPASVEAGWTARLAVSQRQVELAPPEIEEEKALVHQSLVEFVPPKSPRRGRL